MNMQQSILIVEDNMLMRKVARVTLEAEGYQVVEAEDGQRALEAVQRMRPGLILQDLVLPDIDGMDLAGRVHALEGGSRIPIMAMTGFMDRFDVLDTRSGDFLELLYKPVSPADLVAAVERVLPKPALEAPHSPGPVPRATRLMRALAQPLPKAAILMAAAALLMLLSWTAVACLLAAALSYYAIDLTKALRRHESLQQDLETMRAGIEATVRERTAELEQANSEMEAFSYSVSHDLRAPLRAVDGFSRILVDEYGSLLPTEARSYLDRVRQSAKRMGQLVDDLLALSRLARQPVQRVEVDVSALVAECVAEVRQQFLPRKVNVRMGTLPPCSADRRLLRQILLNLLQNAFKYTRDADNAVVEISSAAGESGTVYFVRDNGAGFDMQYADKLFGVFQRMHSAEDFEGTGVGLAIVQRLVVRHGGRIWADASPGLGATFYFNLNGGNRND